VCVDFLHSVCLKHFSFKEKLIEIWSEMYIGLHVKCLLFLSDCNETWIFWIVFRKLLKYKISSISVHWEPRCSLRADRRTDGRTDMTKLIVAFRNSANMRKNVRSHKTWLNFSMLCYNIAGFVIFYKHLILFLSQQWSCTCLCVVVLCMRIVTSDTLV